MIDLGEQMQMEERLEQLKKRLPHDHWDLLAVMLSARGKKPEDIQLRKDVQSSGAILWVAE
jgi:hypothetical protein